MTLVEFLLARIAEDEKAAGDTSDAGRWATNGYAVTGVSPFDGSLRADTQDPRLAHHIARWDPARVLAECEAKRGVVVLYQMAMQHKTEESSEMVRLFAEQSCEDLFDVLRILALPYAGRADFRDEWRVYAASRG